MECNVCAMFAFRAYMLGLIKNIDVSCLHADHDQPSDILVYTPNCIPPNQIEAVNHKHQEKSIRIIS